MCLVLRRARTGGRLEMPLFRRRSQASQWQARLALYSELAG